MNSYSSDELRIFNELNDFLESVTKISSMIDPTWEKHKKKAKIDE